MAICYFDIIIINISCNVKSCWHPSCCVMWSVWQKALRQRNHSFVSCARVQIPKCSRGLLMYSITAFTVNAASVPWRCHDTEVQRSLQRACSRCPTVQRGAEDFLHEALESHLLSAVIKRQLPKDYCAQKLYAPVTSKPVRTEKQLWKKHNNSHMHEEFQTSIYFNRN